MTWGSCCQHDIISHRRKTHFLLQTLRESLLSQVEEPSERPHPRETFCSLDHCQSQSRGPGGVIQSQRQCRGWGPCPRSPSAFAVAPRSSSASRSLDLRRGIHFTRPELSHGIFHLSHSPLLFYLSERVHDKSKRLWPEMLISSLNYPDSLSR